MLWAIVLASAADGQQVVTTDTPPAATTDQSPTSTPDIRELKLKDWSPRPMLKVKESVIERPKYPAIDVHNHLGRGKQWLTSDRVAGFLEEMRAAGVETVVNLDGGWGEELQETLDLLDNRHPGRFLTFALINFDGIDDPAWTQRELDRLEVGFQKGAKGLKVHKSLGLTYRYKDGRLMPVDDPKLDPLWALCAKYDRPVMIHSADPAAFFTPLDANNERWHELNEHPDWLFYGVQFPSRQDILAQLHRVIAKHPETKFICAHFGNNAEELAEVGNRLDELPNMMIDIDARISELGRQPYTARRFLIKYQDRVMFGTDTPCDRDAFRVYYRFLETDDEYFNCDASHHRQGFWPIYGVHLPDEVLLKLYRTNAERVLLGMHARGRAGTEPAADGDGWKTASARKAHRASMPELKVPRVEDFDVTGRGDHAAWQRVSWTSLSRTTGEPSAKRTRVRVAYSPTGVYVAMECFDDAIVATKTADFDELWREDCFEVFLWPSEATPTYFEYEISPKGFELPLLVPNLGGKRFRGWLPWQYAGERRVQKRVAVKSEQDPGSPGWSAELKIPFALLAPIADGVKAGDQWRGNFYRVDVGPSGSEFQSWTPVGDSFHEYEKFGTLVFD